MYISPLTPFKQWRHSSFGNYYIHDIAAKTTISLVEPSSPPRTSYAEWSPTGEAIAFVHSNDLYIRPDAEPNTQAIRLTASGSPTRFNGVPDWVYAEEVFSGESALWWSPDSRKLAFLESDETDVDVYTFPVYNPDSSSWSVHPYTEDVAMRYPKPGYANPRVEVPLFDLAGYLANSEGEETDEEEDEIDDEISEHLFRLTWSPRHPSGESIIMDVTWVGSDDLLVKEVNRAADDGSVVFFDTSNFETDSEVRGAVVRRLGKNGEEGDDGWIESVWNVTNEDVYLDLKKLCLAPSHHTPPFRSCQHFGIRKNSLSGLSK